MHFLSHFYTELPQSEPLFVAALGIPDLTPGFTRVYNSQVLKTATPAQDDLKAIHSGIIRHYAGDKWFHTSSEFVDLVSLFCQSFVTSGLDRRRLRLSVVAHLAAEMMIDRQILVEQREVCELFYEKISLAEERALLRYFEYVGVAEMLSEAYIHRFGMFKQRRFLFLFEDLKNIVFGLNRVYSSATGIEFSEQEQEKMLEVLCNIDEQMRYSWRSVLKP